MLLNQIFGQHPEGKSPTKILFGGGGGVCEPPIHHNHQTADLSSQRIASTKGSEQPLANRCCWYTRWLVMIGREESTKNHFQPHTSRSCPAAPASGERHPFGRDRRIKKLIFSLAIAHIGVKPGRMSPLFPILSRCVVACHFVDSVEREKRTGVQKASVGIGFRRSANKSTFKSEKRGKIISKMHVDTTRDASICRLSEQKTKPSSSEEEPNPSLSPEHHISNLCHVVLVPRASVAVMLCQSALAQRRGEMEQEARGPQTVQQALMRILYGRGR